MKRPSKRQAKNSSTKHRTLSTRCSKGSGRSRGRQKKSASKPQTAKHSYPELFEEEFVDEILGQKVHCLIVRNAGGRVILRRFGMPPFLQSTLDQCADGRWSVSYDFRKVEVAPAAAQVLKGLSRSQVTDIERLMHLLEGFADDAKQRAIAESSSEYSLVLEQINQRAVAVGEEVAHAINQHPDSFFRAMTVLHRVRHRKAENELLLLAIAKAARKFGRVPAMSEVLRVRGYRAHDGLPYDKTTFSKALKRIGFDWLPKAKRSSRMT